MKTKEDLLLSDTEFNNLHKLRLTVESVTIIGLTDVTNLIQETTSLLFTIEFQVDITSLASR